MPRVMANKTTSVLLSLPTEIRLHIYSHIFPKDFLLIDLCSPTSSGTEVYGKSIVGSLLKQHIEVSKLVRRNGLHLLLVCKAIRAEILPILTSTIARFHCEKCYAYFLKTMSQSGGIGLLWLRSVQVEVKLDRLASLPRTQEVVSLIKHQAKDAMERFQKLTWAYYGRLDLMKRETWSSEDLKSYNRVKDGTDSTPDGQSVPLLHSPSEPGDLWLVSGKFNLLEPDQKAGLENILQ